MSDLVDVSTHTGNKPTAVNTHFHTIKNKVPAWLLNASPQTLNNLRSTLGSTSSLIEHSCLSMPDVIRQVQETHARQRLHEQAVREAMAPLPGHEAFAEPLLSAALKARFGLDIDVRNTYLFHARRAQADQSFAAASRDPLVERQKALKNATQTLLAAALQNFEAAEAQIGGMDEDARHKAAIYDHYPINGVALSRETMAIAPEQFAALCRELDLGAKYQAQIDAVFNPPSAPDEAPDAATYNRHGLLKRAEQSAFSLHVHLAYMQKAISEKLYGVLLDVATNKPAKLDNQPVTCSFLRLWEVELTGIVVIGKTRDSASEIEPVAVYIPEDPVCPLKEYPSTLAFAKALRERLLQADYLAFFKRFLPARQANLLLGKLEDHLRPVVWIEEMGWYDRRLDPTAKLHLREHAFSGSFLSEIIRQKIRVLRDDALFHAVPTAAQDQKTFDERVQYFAGTVFQALNIAAFFVPVLGQIMLGVTAIQLSYESYEGIESWSRGERQQALGYLIDVIENAALIAALAAAGAGKTPANERIAVETPSFIEELKPVTLPDGQTRLWKPDLAPFAHDVLLPSGIEPDEFGLYHYQGKTWLALEDKVYSVKPDLAGSQYHLEHPTKVLSYEPPLRHNGAGAWQHELDRPLEWEGLTLFRRLGSSTLAFSDETAQRILRVSDTHEAVLRRVLSENLRPPALLEDTMRRFKLDQEIERSLPDSDLRTRAGVYASRYRALSVSQLPGVAMIERVYPALPTPIAEELVRSASPADLEQLASGKVPAHMAEEIRAYQQQVRLTRAYEGLYLESVINPDTDRLILHTLEHLPGWSPDVRLEVRMGTFHGPLIDSVGAENAVIRKVLSKVADGYEAYDAEGHALHGRDTLYASVLHALPDAPRLALGFPGVWDGPGLKRAVQQSAALPRRTLRQVLRMQPVRPGHRSPMRLADGRAGYPLSGRGAMGGYITRDTLLDLIRWLDLQDEARSSAEAILTALEDAGLSRERIHGRLLQLLAERQALETDMNAWGDASAALPGLNARIASRERIHDAIWQHWTATHLPEIGRGSAPLRLQQVYLVDFPGRLPEFFFQRVDQLQLVETPLMPAPFTYTDIPAFDAFLSRFSRIRSLEISCPQSTGGLQPLSSTLLGLVAHYLPELRELRLINQDILLISINTAPLRRLAHLERLDLSGNRFIYLPSADLSGLRLRYLGLDRTGMDHWPSWLDSRTLDLLDELSLRDNHLTVVPEYLWTTEAGGGHHTEISLQGNALFPDTLMRLRLNNDLPGRRFSLNVDLPPPVQARLDKYVRERALLRDAIDNWAQASSSTMPLSEERVQARTRIGETILAFWRLYSAGSTFSPLHLEGIALVDFPPQLPVFFYPRVRNIHLTRVSTTPGQLNRFLQGFEGLTHLSFRGHVQPMTSLPSVLLELPVLESLTLEDQGLLVDQQAMTFFGRMPTLSSLDLHGNRLGEITDVSGLAPHLRNLYLSNTGLQSWPNWLDDLLPLSFLDLDNNQLTELPDHILYNPRNDNGHTEISLLNNPLSHDTVYRAHVSEAPNQNRSYSFNMHVPEDIRAIRWHQSHDSDTGSESNSSSSGHIHSPLIDPAEEIPDVEAWLLGSIEENEAHRALWQQLEDDTQAGDLLGLVGRLTQTAPYRTASTRAEFAGRVWRVLEVAALDTQDRLLFNGMAQEALVHPDTGDQTCHDGAWLVFNQIEIRIFTEQSLKDVPETLRGQTLYRLTRRLYRLQELDDIAREQAGTRDEAEVRLAYRLRWAEELDLPLPPSNMLYRAVASIRPGELDAALARVQQGENGEPFMRYAAQRDFWVDYLRQAHAERFTALEQAYQERVLAVPDRFPGQSIEALAEQYAALQRQYENEQQVLIRELTIQEGLDHG